MKKLLPFLLTASAFQLFSPSAFSLEPANWQYRQEFDIAQPGAVRISLPPETLDRAQPDLGDLRIVGPDGIELPYTLLELPAAREARESLETTRRPVALQLSADKRELAVTLETDTTAPLDSVELLIPDTAEYLVPARVEISSDGQKWERVSSGQPLFRRNQGSRHDAVVQNTLTLHRRGAAHVRITIYDQTADSAPIVITGARLHSIKETAARAAFPDEATPARIVSTDERAGETRITIDLGAANLSLATLAFDVADPLFVRRVTLFSGEHTIAREAPIYRIAIDDEPAMSKTALAPGSAIIPTRQIIARIENGDSPPLHVRGVSATRRPAHIALNPLAAGRYTLLSGNAQAAAPRYDLAVISEKLARLPLTKIAASEIVETPNYVAPKPPAEPRDFASKAFFWVALAAVVIVLLVVLAKLLPKPKG